MNQHQERDGGEDRTPGGKTRVKYIIMESVRLKEESLGLIMDRAKWKNDIQTNSGDPRWWQKPDEMNNKIVNKERHMGVPLFYECGVVSAIKLLSSSREPVR